jgi:predicted ATPase with chaperone activity
MATDPPDRFRPPDPGLRRPPVPLLRPRLQSAPPPPQPRVAGAEEPPAPARPIIDLDRARVELPPKPSRFQPREPRTWEELGIDDLMAEQIVLRYLLGVGSEQGRNLATELCIAGSLSRDLLEGMRQRKLIQTRSTTAVGDFVYELTEAGRERALDYRRQCTYVGPVPVPMDQYLKSVEEQTLRHLKPTPEDLTRAFADLVVQQSVRDRLGPAISSCRALFLHGEAGNGKTSIAERVMRCFGDSIWIPHTLYIDGHLVKLYDPGTHSPLDPAFKPLTSAERLDRRWIRIRRPTVVAGGELTLEMLEIQQSPHTHICEAPLQLKANGGTLVIDDFGRQRIPPQVLLNRWIFPLERRIDFLRLPDGRKITSPFDPLLVFSTNLEPRELMDEAFLRRIPYKINVVDPTDDEFGQLVEVLAPTMDIVIEEGSVEYLIEVHFRRSKRPMRFCHPRDLLEQIRNHAAFERRPALAGRFEWDLAVANYFGIM